LKKILVTGGAGFIGTNLIKRLLKDNHKVVSVDNYSTGLIENHQHGCQYFNVDISEVTDFNFFMDTPDVIFHLAAIPRIQPSFNHPVDTYHANSTSTINLLEWARRRKCKVIYAGSSSFHGGINKNPYTMTKYFGEQLCELYYKHFGMDINICRFYNVYGPHQLTEGEYCTVVGIFENLYKNNKPLTITWDGEQRRDFTHVDDIVDGLILTSECKSWGVSIELGRGKNHSINDLADMFDNDYPREYIDKKPGEVRSTLCDVGGAYSIISYDPKRNLYDYIQSIKKGDIYD
jgi:UDP-glucose 4-epimerase